MAELTRLERLEIEGYKSVGIATMDLPMLTFLVGRNGAGKSNVVDGLRFVGDAINNNLDTAFQIHGGPGNLLKLGHDGVKFRIGVNDPATGLITYVLEIGVEARSNYSIVTEEIRFGDEVSDLRAFGSDEEPIAARTLALPLLAARNSQYRVMLDFLKLMRFYDFSTSALTHYEQPQLGEFLRSDGGNICSVLATMKAQDSLRFDRLTEYMRQILPGLRAITPIENASFQLIRFDTTAGGFHPVNMSSGTLLSLAVITALFQSHNSVGQRPSLIAIEEPERSLHPAAVGTLFDAMVEASEETQILITTQSPDLLNRKDVEADSLRVVVSSEGGTVVGVIPEAAKEVVSSHLFTAGELIRLDQLGQPIALGSDG